MLISAECTHSCIFVAEMLVFKSKVLYNAPARCKDPKECAPGHLFICYSQYKPIKKLEKACTHRVHRFQNPCTRQPKCAHRLQGAPLISNTVLILFFSILYTRKVEVKKTLFQVKAVFKIKLLSYEPAGFLLYCASVYYICNGKKLKKICVNCAHTSNNCVPGCRGAHASLSIHFKHCKLERYQCSKLRVRPAPSVNNLAAGCIHFGTCAPGECTLFQSVSIQYMTLCT